MASRRKSRERALQVLFLIDLRKMDADEAIAAYTSSLHNEDEDFAIMPRDKFMEHLVRGAVRDRENIDFHILRASSNWRLDRMPSVDRNILRLATFELVEGKLPAAVVIDEALELARRFSGNESVGFVNGVLDSVRSALQSSTPGPTRADASQPEPKSSDLGQTAEAN